ncbi:MAG: ABC transporter permease [Polyangiaceae bacterium]
MNIFQTFLVSLRAVYRNRMRSFLTALGIIIGVGAVITMMAIGAGAKAQVEAAFAAMGNNLLVIQAGSSSTGGVKGGAGTQPTLSWDDLTAIRDEVPSVKRAAPYLRSSQTILGDDQNWSTSIIGTSPEYFDIRSWPVSTGVGISDADITGNTKVVVLGQTVVDNLYGKSANAVGQTVRINHTPFEVIGVASKKGQSTTGQDYDDVAFVPSGTFAQKIQGGFGRFLQGQIYVEAKSSDVIARALSDITALLRDRHKLQADDADDFQIRNMTEIASAKQAGTDTMTTLLASVAAVSLLVGGIGIMNIMLVSVTERTREIGIRMAIGAKPRIILLQFLIEALVLSMGGGIIGIGAGVGSAQYIAGKFGWPILVQPAVIGMSFGFSALVGVVFGLYPARKASQLDPIDALRYE